jgi:hypothetical protein
VGRRTGEPQLGQHPGGRPSELGGAGERHGQPGQQRPSGGAPLEAQLAHPSVDAEVVGEQPVGQGGDEGHAGEHESGRGAGRGPDAGGEQHHAHPSGGPEHDRALGDRGDTEGERGAQALGQQHHRPAPALGHADGGDVDRHEQHAEVEHGGRGQRQRGPQAAVGDQAGAGQRHEGGELGRPGDLVPADGHERGRGGDQQEGAEPGGPQGAGRRAVG